MIPQICLFAKALLKFLFVVLWPIKSVHYFGQFKWLLDQLNHSTNGPRSDRCRRLVQCLDFLLILYCLNNLYLTFAGLFNVTEHQRQLHFDYFHELLPKVNANWIPTVACLCTIYFNRVLLFDYDPQLLDLMDRILIHRNCQWFLGPRLGRRCVSSIVRKHYLIVLNLFHGGTLRGGE